MSRISDFALRVLAFLIIAPFQLVLSLMLHFWVKDEPHVKDARGYYSHPEYRE